MGGIHVSSCCWDPRAGPTHTCPLCLSWLHLDPNLRIVQATHFGSPACLFLRPLPSQEETQESTASNYQEIVFITKKKSACKQIATALNSHPAGHTYTPGGERGSVLSPHTELSRELGPAAARDTRGWAWPSTSLGPALDGPWKPPPRAALSVHGHEVGDTGVWASPEAPRAVCWASPPSLSNGLRNTASGLEA